MRYVRILFLHLQNIFAHRSKSMVWFLIALINPLVLILFWRGSGRIDSSFTPNMITSYYLTLVIADALLMAHIEEVVSDEDIHQGYLSQYLLKPLAYYWFKFYQEIPIRILQGIYGFIVWIIFSLFFGSFIRVTNDPLMVLLALTSTIIGFFLAFTFKMLLGLTGFWLRDNQATFHLVDAILLVFGGYIVPLPLMPELLSQIANVLPFSYMIYYPIVLFQGVLEMNSIFIVFSMQCLWLAIFYSLYTISWHKGVRKFSAIGQ